MSTANTLNAKSGGIISNLIKYKNKRSNVFIPDGQNKLWKNMNFVKAVEQKPRYWGFLREDETFEDLEMLMHLNIKDAADRQIQSQQRPWQSQQSQSQEQQQQQQYYTDLDPEQETKDKVLALLDNNNMYKVDINADKYKLQKDLDSITEYLEKYADEDEKQNLQETQDTMQKIIQLKNLEWEQNITEKFRIKSQENIDKLEHTLKFGDKNKINMAITQNNLEHQQEKLKKQNETFDNREAEMNKLREELGLLQPAEVNRITWQYKNIDEYPEIAKRYPIFFYRTDEDNTELIKTTLEALVDAREDENQRNAINIFTMINDKLAYDNVINDILAQSKDKPEALAEIFLQEYILFELTRYQAFQNIAKKFATAMEMDTQSPWKRQNVRLYVRGFLTKDVDTAIEDLKMYLESINIQCDEELNELGAQLKKDHNLLNVDNQDDTEQKTDENDDDEVVTQMQAAATETALQTPNKMKIPWITQHTPIKYANVQNQEKLNNFYNSLRNKPKNTYNPVFNFQFKTEKVKQLSPKKGLNKYRNTKKKKQSWKTQSKWDSGGQHRPRQQHLQYKPGGKQAADFYGLGETRQSISSTWGQTQMKPLQTGQSTRTTYRSRLNFNNNNPTYSMMRGQSPDKLFQQQTRK